MKLKVALVGCGNIGFAIAKALRAGNCGSCSNLSVLQRSETRTIFLKESLDCQVSQDPTIALHNARVIVIAVKPQDFAAAASQIAPFISSDQLIISVMAGVTIATIANKLAPAHSIVRCMPNLPARINKAITPFVTNTQLSDENLALTQEVLSSFGKTLQLNSELAIDAATAISGSGPTYFYLFVESLLASAAAIGLTAKEAQLLVQEMIAGSLALWQNNLDSLTALRDAPRSRAGTTEAAFNVLESNNFKQIIIDAVDAAFKRAQELSRLVSSES